MICICLCLSQCSWKTFWHSNLCGGDNFSRLQSLTKCWHTVFKWGSWGQKQSALLPSPHHSMLWCLLLYSLLVAHTVQQHSIAWRGWGRDPGEYSGLQVTRMIDWRQKSKPKKIPGPKFNPPKNQGISTFAVSIKCHKGLLRLVVSTNFFCCCICLTFVSRCIVLWSSWL